MAELIATIPNTRAGWIAIEHLRSRAGDFGCEYSGALSDYLGELNAARYLPKLPFTFHLLATEDGREATVTNRILQWHSGELVDRPHGRVEAVEPNYRLYPLAALGLPFQLGGDHKPYLSIMRVKDAHNNNVTGAKVRVAVLDTGLDSKAAFKPRDFYDVVNANNLHPVPPAPTDNDGHGTAMAELVQAVAPDADIYIIRVLDNGQTGKLNLWNVLAGIGVAIADCDADIVNLSLGFSSLVQKCPGCGAALAVRVIAFEKLTETATPGTSKLPLYVAATGNSGSNNSFDFPSSSEKCVAVGAVDSGLQRSSFSNYGISHKRYLMAPGGQETSAGNFTEDVGKGAGVTACAGTSVAAAYVSGMLALFRSEPRYATLGRDNFMDTVLANHCALPAHAQNKPTEYGSGIIEYSPPTLSQASTSNNLDQANAAAASRIWSDGTFVYIGNVQLKINDECK
jgi:subtilisin family serine protease